MKHIHVIRITTYAINQVLIIEIMLKPHSLLFLSQRMKYLNGIFFVGYIFSNGRIYFLASFAKSLVLAVVDWFSS